ncbi:hypothetical protein C0989_007680 [Termitomyces sp. Mn162]|nr:hypothetical protein C0989_007680 [Termitomyces sp. Mn162]
MIHVEDKSLLLADGRVLAYADNGNTSSSELVLFLHGPFAIGDASHLPAALEARNIHYVAPSLPGWGRSSPLSSHARTTTTDAYASTLAADITALITHLHPHTHHKLRLYICAHSFGTVHAQMLYGASHAAFPLAQQLAALILLAPCSPPHCHPTYARALSWPAYILAGPPARYVPCFSLITMHIARLALAPYFTSDTSAQTLLRKYLLPPDASSDTDTDTVRQHTDEQASPNDIDELEQPRPQDHFERTLGRNAHRSVASSWRGFTDMPAVYHSGWGQFSPSSIETTCPVLVVSSENDDVAPKPMAHWLVAEYQNARLKNIPGGHVSAFSHLDEIWNEVFEMVSS